LVIGRLNNAFEQSVQFAVLVECIHLIEAAYVSIAYKNLRNGSPSASLYHFSALFCVEEHVYIRVVDIFAAQ
jgi:hypothetical protein